MPRLVCTLLLLTSCHGLWGAPAGDPAVFRLTETAHGHELKTPDGRTVFQYMTKKPEGSPLTANSTCCLYPVLTPQGTEVVDFAPDDHKHHRGIFLAWHHIEGDPGGDFWGWGKFAPTEERIIRNKSVELRKATAERALIKIENEWAAGDTVLIDEALTITASERKNGYVLTLHYVLTPRHDLTLGQTAFSGFCVKSRKFKGVYSDPDGEVTLAKPHHLKPETNWPAKPWYDYSFELDDGTKAGITIFDHKGNPPTVWHNPKPIAMINPCIVSGGPVKLPKGQALHLRYRLLVHDGPLDARLVNAAGKGFARGLE